MACHACTRARRSVPRIARPSLGVHCTEEYIVCPLIYLPIQTLHGALRKRCGRIVFRSLRHAADARRVRAQSPRRPIWRLPPDPPRCRTPKHHKNNVINPVSHMAATQAKNTAEVAPAFNNASLAASSTSEQTKGRALPRAIARSNGQTHTYWNGRPRALRSRVACLRWARAGTDGLSVSEARHAASDTFLALSRESNLCHDMEIMQQWWH